MEGKLKEFKTSGDVRNKELIAEHEKEMEKVKEQHKKALAKKDGTAADLESEIKSLNDNIQDRLKEIDIHKA